MIRIAKAGYIEVPSRIWETCRGHEPGIAGLSHHRWLIDIDQQASSIRFLSKFHRIHNWRYSLPKSVLRRLDDAASVKWLFWEGSFSYEEVVIHGEENQLAELEGFVARVRSYPRPLLVADDAFRRGKHIARRAVNKGLRTLGFA